MRKLFYILFKQLFVASILFLFLISCSDDKNENNFIYLDSYQQVRTLGKDQLVAQVSLGTIIYPEVDVLIPLIQYGISTYKITYHTTFNGDDVIASGLVCIPDGQESFPVLSFQNGTNTCNSNAPTVNLSNSLYSLIGGMASNGYILVMSDYLGFGESSEYLHPYMHKQSSNQVISDIILAAKELVQSVSGGASTNGELFLAGYSQGGWATLSALEALEISNSTGLIPVAAACGAGAYDLTAVTKHILALSSYDTPHYLPYFIQSRISNGIMDGPLSLYFNEPFASTIPSLFDGSLCNGAVSDALTPVITDLMTSNLIANFELAPEFADIRDELSQNSVNAWPASAKIRFYHSSGDESVPPTQSSAIYSSFMGLGLPANDISIEIVDNASLTHNDAVIGWGIDAFLWFNDIRR